MFLCEGACGKMKKIVRDDSSLKAAPPGYDSVHAVGGSEPDPALDTTLVLDGKEVIVPQGKPIKSAELADQLGGKSTFSQSEYLLYSESQLRIRYALTFRWG